MAEQRDMDGQQALRELMRAHATGRLTRRELLRRAAALGVSASALGAMLSLGGASAAAQGTAAAGGYPQMGTYSGKTLRVSISLQETEKTFFNDVVVPKFQDLTKAKVDLLSIEAADVIKTLQAQVSSGNIKIDLVDQDNNSLAPLVADKLVEELPNATEIMPPETIAALKPVLQFDNTYYFLPARPNVQITYYDSKQFDDWGIKPPTTWDELMSVAKTMKDKAGIGKLSIQGVPGGAVGVTVTQFLWQAGGDPLQINTDAGVKAFTYMQNLKPYLTPQYPTATFDTTNTYILNGSVDLAQNWPFGVNVIVSQGGKKEVLTYDGWSGPAGNFLVLGGDVFGVVKGTPNKDLALDFAKYFMSKPVQEELTANLGWPAIRSDAFGAVQAWQKPYFQTISQALTHVKARPNVTYWLTVENILTDAFNDIVTSGKDVKPTLDAYQKKIDQAKGTVSG